MRNVNKALRKKCFEMLNGNLTVNGYTVPVYNKYLPSVIDKAWYVVIRTVNNTDDSNINCNKTNTSVQFGIYSKDTMANSGDAIEEIADQIYDIIYPTPQSTIDLAPNFQVGLLKLDGDFSPDALQTDNAVYINRFITFACKILHYPNTVSV